MTAEEFFGWVRDCARELERMGSETLPDIAPRRSGTGGTSKPGGSPDPVGTQVAAKVDAEERQRRRRARLTLVLEHGRWVSHLVGLAMGQDVAIALRAHYVDLEGLEVIASELHVSLRTLYSMRRRAFEYVDCAGIVKDDDVFALMRTR